MSSFCCDGVRNVSMNEICRRADVWKPGVYREFASGDGLMEVAVEHHRATVIGLLIGLLRSDRPFPDVLQHLLRFITEPDGRPPGCLLAEFRLLRWMEDSGWLTSERQGAGTARRGRTR